MKILLIEKPVPVKTSIDKETGKTKSVDLPRQAVYDHIPICVALDDDYNRIKHDVKQFDPKLNNGEGGYKTVSTDLIYSKNQIETMKRSLVHIEYVSEKDLKAIKAAESAKIAEIEQRGYERALAELGKK